jgi:hypothetical protein
LTVAPNHAAALLPESDPALRSALGDLVDGNDLSADISQLLRRAPLTSPLWLK